jgi:hypothetical protein
MTEPFSKALKWFAVFIASLIFVGGVWFASSQSGPAAQVLPNPNGYEDLLKAARMLEADADYSTLIEEQLRAQVGKNAEALIFTKKGLARESRVKLNYSTTNAAHLNELALLKHLAQALIAQGKLAEIDHHPREAADAYLNAIRLGHQAEEGGIVIDSMVAIAIEALGTAALDKLTPQLSAEECRNSAARLAEVERGREPSEAILAQERAWARRTFGLKGLITQLLVFKQTQTGEQRWAAKRKTQGTRTQALLVKLGTRAYELKKASAANVNDLVPADLKIAPQFAP